MAIRKVRIYGDSALKKKSRLVREITEEDKQVLEDMVETMLASNGVGLAAPQIGINRQLIVIKAEEGPLKLINPRILKRKGRVVMKEGCLSFPGIFVDIWRAKEIIVQALNEKGERLKIGAEGLTARIIQHEVDHLKGILIKDRMGFMDKIRLRRFLKELKKMSRTIS